MLRVAYYSLGFTGIQDRVLEYVCVCVALSPQRDGLQSQAGVNMRPFLPLISPTLSFQCFMGCVLWCHDLPLTPVPPSRCRIQECTAAAKTP